jgi:hypothetical protein
MRRRSQAENDGAHVYVASRGSTILTSVNECKRLTILYYKRIQEMTLLAKEKGGSSALEQVRSVE